MSGASSFLRKSSLHRRLFRPDNASDPTTTIFQSFLRQQPAGTTSTISRLGVQHLRAYNGNGLPSKVFRKSKECNELSPSLSPSWFSSSSSGKSGSTASFLKSGFVSWYLEMLKSRPVLTKSVTSSVIYVAADLSSQTISQSSSESYDWMRTTRMGGYGLLISGPSLHFWFNFMSRIFPKRDLISTFKKILMGQTVFGPFLTVVFFSLNARLQGETGPEIIARLKRDLLPTMINGVMYWPLCDFITFKFIPVHLQPLVSNSFSYLWTVYMTYMASLEKVGASS